MLIIKKMLSSLILRKWIRSKLVKYGVYKFRFSTAKRSLNMLLNGQVIVITGASRGVGAAIARELAMNGALVVCNYLNQTTLAVNVVAAIKQMGGRAVSYQCDIRDPDAAKEMIDAIYREHGRIDALINSAISGKQNGKLADVAWSDYLEQINVSVKATLNMANASRGYMKLQGGGSIVNIITEVWNQTPEEWSPYLVGKGALVGLSRSLVTELGRDNIRVNMVAPGWVKTEQMPVGTDTSGYVQGVPLGRQGDASEVGGVCVFLVSSLSSFVSGAYIPVSGGSVRQMGA